MFTILVLLVGFVGGVYVGARWSEKIKSIYYSIFSN